MMESRYVLRLGLSFKRAGEKNMFAEAIIIVSRSTRKHGIPNDEILGI